MYKEKRKERLQANLITMFVTILNKPNFDKCIKAMGVTNENVEEFKKSCFISIIDTLGYSGPSYFDSDKSNVKIMYFDDVDEDGAVGMWNVGEPLKMFTKDQATELIDFIENQKDKDFCFVHCFEGISRSGAIGTFINDYFGTENYYEFMRRNPQIQPNGKVLQLLKRELRNRFEKETL